VISGFAVQQKRPCEKGGEAGKIDDRGKRKAKFWYELWGKGAYPNARGKARKARIKRP
jgi:hypothetical protein